MQKVLEVKDLKKRIGKTEIIKGISFYLNEGEIFGFLGPNGAGKTTTIRMLVDLISMDSGSISVLGKDMKKDREGALEYIGAVVENPELYGYLSGYKNLIQFARIRKISKERVDEVVKLVGLEGRAKDKVKKYSLGMKQRLGLAAALLSDPKLLILDEPTNGLDPNGIIEFRTLLQKLAREKGLSVFVSSHILGEIQQLCDTVAFVEDGKITSIESMNVMNNSLFYLIETNKSEEITKKLQAIEGIVSVKEHQIGYVIELEKTNPSDVMKAIMKQDIEVNAFEKYQKGLEERYLEVIKGGIR
jgi:ABC-2 type transport system ATP-binding protein